MEFIIVLVFIIQQVRRKTKNFIKIKSLCLVNYRHEQDIYVRMIDSVSKNVCIFFLILKKKLFGINFSQLFMKVKIKILKCVEFY